ncbi:hypothetical protein [Burkholderia sp. Ac-20392]|uniref:hypothetical protein n=1 Tax=Burkholderia sp. Ac-20392 TaxID=2703905 RepID=UPI00197FE92D|nr:hypothetical protein [Burkholderia sp. Ac-20392]MBN3796525.1 hypothetical protein [Burkholderia sp. Ac-20392]
MTSIVLLKILIAVVPGLLSAIRHAPKAIRVLMRWYTNSSRRKAAAIVRDMRKIRYYQINQSAIKSETLKDLIGMTGMFIISIPIFWIALSPSKTGWDRIANMVLGLEGIVVLILGIFIFNRVTTRLNRARDPHRTLLLDEIRLMRTRLDLTEIRIRNTQTPIFKNEADLLRTIVAKLPQWNINSESQSLHATCSTSKPLNSSIRKIKKFRTSTRSSPRTE